MAVVQRSSTAARPREEAHPVAAQHLLDVLPPVAAVGQRAARAGLSGVSSPLRVQRPPVGPIGAVDVGRGELRALLGADVAPEVGGLVLGEVGPDGDVVDADALDKVVDGVDVVRQRGARARLQEGDDARGADYSAALREPPDGLVRLVAGHVVVRSRVGVGDGDRLLGGVDDVQGRPVADVGQVDEDAEAVHLGDRLGPEVGQPSGNALVAAVAEQVALVVGDLDDADAESVEEGEPVQAVFDGRRVLEAEYDARPAVALGGEDVVGRPDRGDRVGALPEPGVPPGEVVDRLPEALPCRDSGVDGGDAAGAQAIVDGVAVPVADVQPVHDDGVAVGLNHRVLGAHGVAKVMG